MVTWKKYLREKSAKDTKIRRWHDFFSLYLLLRNLSIIFKFLIIYLAILKWKRSKEWKKRECKQQMNVKGRQKKVNDISFVYFYLFSSFSNDFVLFQPFCLSISLPHHTVQKKFSSDLFMVALSLFLRSSIIIL